MAVEIKSDFHTIIEIPSTPKGRRKMKVSNVMTHEYTLPVVITRLDPAPILAPPGYMDKLIHEGRLPPRSEWQSSVIIGFIKESDYKDGWGVEINADNCHYISFNIVAIEDPEAYL